MTRGGGTVAEARPPRFPTYSAPARTAEVDLSVAVDHRHLSAAQQTRLALPGAGPVLYCAGDLALFRRKCIAIVGSRKASDEGLARAGRLARELARAGIVVVSGLAEGVDFAAHTAALEAGGRTIAVIGTGLDKAYPAAHGRLQEQIWRDHLLVSPFATGSAVYQSNFPARNRVMAAITDGTVIIEASDTSGTLHQARECASDRLGRPLFLLRSVVDNRSVRWPSRFVGTPGTHVIETSEEIIDHLR